jgi:hypothetical protein
MAEGASDPTGADDRDFRPWIMHATSGAPRRGYCVLPLGKGSQLRSVAAPGGGVWQGIFSGPAAVVGGGVDVIQCRARRIASPRGDTKHLSIFLRTLVC